jgi:Flp pilus assembly CpaF family ATPase
MCVRRVIPDITRRHMAVNIRKFVLQAHSLDELVALGTLTAQAAPFLEAAVASGLNVLVSGGTQAGKTTLDICWLWHTSVRDYRYDPGRLERWCAGRFRGRGGRWSGRPVLPDLR